MPLRHYPEQGTSKAAIARTLGISRRTVHHWIDARLREYPMLTAVRVFDEV